LGDASLVAVGDLIVTISQQGTEKAEKAAVCCLVTLVGHGVGPRVIMGMAWSGVDLNLAGPGDAGLLHWGTSL
jgi:hypothetical protein